MSKVTDEVTFPVLENLTGINECTEAVFKKKTVMLAFKILN